MILSPHGYGHRAFAIADRWQSLIDEAYLEVQNVRRRSFSMITDCVVVHAAGGINMALEFLMTANSKGGLMVIRIDGREGRYSQDSR